MRRVSIAPEGDYSPPPSPGPSNFCRKSSQGSPVPSHISFASQSRSRLDPSSNQPAVSVPSTSATSAPATAPASAPAATSAAQIPANRFSAVYDQTSQPYGNYWRPVIHSQGVFGAPFTQFGVAAQQPPTPSPVNPPDELGPPPPPPPPPAIPPVINPHGVHFQPQVPGTELGPMIHRYVPRHDPYGAAGSIFPGLQLPTYMVSALIGLSTVLVPYDVAVLPTFTRSHVAHNVSCMNQIERASANRSLGQRCHDAYAVAVNRCGFRHGSHESDRGATARLWPDDDAEPLYTGRSAAHAPDPYSGLPDDRYSFSNWRSDPTACPCRTCNGCWLDAQRDDCTEYADCTE